MKQTMNLRKTGNMKEKKCPQKSEVPQPLLRKTRRSGFKTQHVEEHRNLKGQCAQLQID